MIPIFTLDRQNNDIKEKINSAIDSVFNSNHFILGNQVRDFEYEFAEYCDSRYAVGVGSGTDAIRTALWAAGVGIGDEVITVANTAVFTALAISMCGANPVFVDINPDDYTMDASKLDTAVTEKTKAIVPVHLFGQCADMNKINEVADKYGLTVIEDACQAHGALYNSRKAGSMGKAGCFSFYPSKNLGAFGDGGIVITDDKEFADKIKAFRNGGQENRFSHRFIGVNSRLDEIQAAVLRVKLKYLDTWNNQRRKIAKLYDSLISDNNVIKQDEMEFRSHVYHLYVIRNSQRDSLKKYLEANKIQAQIHYPTPIYSHKAYEYLNVNKNLYPITEKYAREVLSIPIFPELVEDEIYLIGDCINRFQQ